MSAQDGAPTSAALLQALLLAQQQNAAMMKTLMETVAARPLPLANNPANVLSQSNSSQAKSSSSTLYTFSDRVWCGNKSTTWVNDAVKRLSTGLYNEMKRKLISKAASAPAGDGNQTTNQFVKDLLRSSLNPGTVDQVLKGFVFGLSEKKVSLSR